VAGLTITPTVSSTFPVTSVAWTIDGTSQPPVSTAPFALTLSVSPLAPGPHVVSCTATDDRGRTSAPTSLTITK
jgi:hypothetical protein